MRNLSEAEWKELDVLISIFDEHRDRLEAVADSLSAQHREAERIFANNMWEDGSSCPRTEDLEDRVARSHEELMLIKADIGEHLNDIYGPMKSELASQRIMQAWGALSAYVEEGPELTSLLGVVNTPTEKWIIGLRLRLSRFNGLVRGGWRKLGAQGRGKELGKNRNLDS
jgi:hypothetical protein